MKSEYILGIWDGHDAGAALIRGDEIIFAINEERLSRRKLEVGMPRLSIDACMQYAGLKPEDIKTVAASTTDPAKTLTRVFPSLKEQYYLIRRRKKAPDRLDFFKKIFKYRFTELPPNFASRAVSRRWLRTQLGSFGFRDYELRMTDHHRSHATAAAFCSGFNESLVMTLDGVGDGLSGSLWTLKNGSMELVKSLPATTSLGVFFEHVTNLMNMRELEDEGKVMALANYAYPIADEENPLLELMGTKDLQLSSNLRSTELFRELKKILWRYPSEQFAYMAQRALERNVLALTSKALRATRMRKIAVAGGVFSNIKTNMKIAHLPEVDGVYVFPHMGDGGLALGAAMAVNYDVTGQYQYRLKDLYLGPAYGLADIMAALEKTGTHEAGTAGDDQGAADDLIWQRIENPAEAAADLIMAGEIILWYRGRMEIGPRALGNRSILARPDDPRMKDRLNLLLKKRVWYQPFCPSMLTEDAPSLLQIGKGRPEDNPFMTTAFPVRVEKRGIMGAVINVDGTCRPQFVGDENPAFRELLSAVKSRLGYGVLLNTSFNIHGEPVVCTPDEAIAMLKATGIRYLFMEDVLVENLDAKNL
ncbi:MAG: carbamoyltransferase C-terminal domain-containing protein [Smithellaceae bacterium]|nr:carbamoyltransferase C-terminal domain-containing protein [Smithellaceae bacterium]